MIGDLNLLKGTYYTKGSISYIKQNPWIQDLSIRGL
jgi:hypothetical protein